MKKFFTILAMFVFFCSNAFAKEEIEFQNPQAGVYIFKINTKCCVKPLLKRSFQHMAKRRLKVR